MKINQKNLLKTSKFAMVLVVLIVLAFQTAILARASVVSYTDPKDDIRCFTEDQLEEYEWDYYESDNPQTIIDSIEEFWSHGTQSATPDCIDMIFITVDNEYSGNTSVRITIQVDGRFADCPEALFLIYSNCSDDSYVLGWIAVYTEWGETYEEGGYLTDGSEETYEMHVNLNEAGDELAFVMPRTDDDCCLNILGFTWNDAGNVLCADLFKSCAKQTENPLNPGENPKDTKYIGLDPITSFIDNLSYLMFGLLCGRLPYILFVALLLIVGKCLIDRRNIYIRVSGWAVDSLVLYTLIWYSINVFFHLDVEDPVLDFSLLSLIDLFSCLFLIVFVAYSYANNFGLIGDGEWSWILAYAFMFVETILFMSPWYYYYCSGDPLLTLILLIVALAPCGLALFLTEIYSKKRLP